MNQSQEKNQVLIVGAGPTGLVLALWLKKRGISFRIISKLSGPGLTSRALAVQARTLEFYRQLGIADELIAAGVQATEVKLRRNGNVVAKAVLGPIGQDMSPFAYLLFCAQDIHEALLCAKLKELGVEVEWNSELIDLIQNKASVTAKIYTENGEESEVFDYIVGCDGAHSIVRKKLPTEFPGGTYSQVFYVADVMAHGDALEKCVQISVSLKDFCIIMPIKAQGSVRLTGVVPPDKEKNAEIVFDDVRASVERNTGLKIDKVNWFSTYHVHHRIAEHFQEGRVFIAGDAGHIHSPAGGQGMNTGIGDAVNLAWKLADVIQGRASAKILQSYETERRAFAKVLVQTTDRAFRVVASRKLPGSILRAYILPLLMGYLTKLRPVLKLMFRTLSQIRIHYRQSFLSVGEAGSIAPGDRLPWVKTSEGNNFDTLKSLDWQIHIYGTLQKDFAAHINSAPIHIFNWNNETEKRGLMQNAVYVIRPDGYIGFASPNQDAKKVEEYFKDLKG